MSTFVKKYFFTVVFLSIVLGSLVFILPLRSSKKLLAAGGETIDTLDFFISKHAIGGVLNPQSLGVTQYVTKNFSYIAKSNAQYEYHTWNNDYIFLTQDTSIGDYKIGGKIATSYRILPGVWMKRFMQVGEKIDSPVQVDWYDKFCRVAVHWDYWQYNTYLESHKTYNVGGDLGQQEVIILRYDYGSGYEKFYYSKEWGWIRWEEWDTETKALKRSVDFNRFQDGFLQVKPKCGAPSNIPTVTPTGSNSQSGDANGDNRVDGQDYVIWLNHYNQYTNNGVKDGDFNSSGRVDGADYTIWLNNQR